jgi:hypothetical protein
LRESHGADNVPGIVQDPVAEVDGGSRRRDKPLVKLPAQLRDGLVDERFERRDSGGGVILGDRLLLLRVLGLVSLAENVVYDLAVDEGSDRLV